MRPFIVQIFSSRDLRLISCLVCFGVRLHFVSLFFNCIFFNCFWVLRVTTLFKRLWSLNSWVITFSWYTCFFTKSYPRDWVRDGIIPGQLSEDCLFVLFCFACFCLEGIRMFMVEEPH